VNKLPCDAVADQFRRVFAEPEFASKFRALVFAILEGRGSSRRPTRHSANGRTRDHVKRTATQIDCTGTLDPQTVGSRVARDRILLRWNIKNRRWINLGVMSGQFRRLIVNGRESYAHLRSSIKLFLKHDCQASPVPVHR
jgi:hypothetical protein